MDFEIKLIEFLQAGRSQFFDVSFQIISIVGSTLGVVALCLFLFMFKRKLCFWYIFSYGFVHLFVNCLKNLIERVRPFNVSDTISNIGDVVHGYSFPSGHAACATAIAIFLGVFLFSCYKKKSTRVAIVLFCSFYVGLVCLSRMYLGKHFLTDVLAGVLVSAVVCGLGLLLMYFFSKHNLKGKRKNENKN